MVMRYSRVSQESRLDIAVKTVEKPTHIGVNFQ